MGNRDDVINMYQQTGLSKADLHRMTGIATTTIDRILDPDAGVRESSVAKVREALRDYLHQDELSADPLLAAIRSLDPVDRELVTLLVSRLTGD